MQLTKSAGLGAFTFLVVAMSALAHEDDNSQSVFTRAKDLEQKIRNSKMCKHYPDVVKIQKNNTAVVSTYCDRTLTDKDAKFLALNLAKMVITDFDEISIVKVRLYDPASTKYWRDITLNSQQIACGLKAGPEQRQFIDSIDVLNNFGLVDGADLKYRVQLYKHILRLQKAGVDVKNFRAQLGRIELSEKKHENVSSQLKDLDALLASADGDLIKNISSQQKDNPSIADLEGCWKDACTKEEADYQVVRNLEQEKDDFSLPEGRDLDADERSENQYAAIQQNLDTAMQTWLDARHYRDQCYQEMVTAKERLAE